MDPAQYRLTISREEQGCIACLSATSPPPRHRYGRMVRPQVVIQAMTRSLAIHVFTRITVDHGVGGGMEQHLQQLAEGLAERGHTITVVTTAHPAGLREIGRDGVRFLFLPGTTPGTYSRQWWRASRAVLGALPRADILWSQSVGARSVAGAPGVPPAVAWMHGTTMSLWRTGRTQLAADPSPRMLLAVARQGLAGVRSIWQARRSHFAAIIAPSRQQARDVAWEFGVPVDRVAVIYNAADTTHFRPDPEAGRRLRAEAGLSEDSPLLLFVGRLVAPKGAEMALTVLRSLRQEGQDAHLWIVGTGPESARLQAESDDLGHAVRFWGFQPTERLPAFYNAADLTLMPTRYDEAFSLVVVEALACGTVLLASNRGGNLEAVEDGISGRLLPATNPGVWSQVVSVLLHDPAQRRAFSVAARRRAEREFSLMRMLDQAEALFVEVANGR